MEDPPEGGVDGVDSTQWPRDGRAVYEYLMELMGIETQGFKEDLIGEIGIGEGGVERNVWGWIEIRQGRMTRLKLRVIFFLMWVARCGGT